MLPPEVLPLLQDLQTQTGWALLSQRDGVWSLQHHRLLGEAIRAIRSQPLQDAHLVLSPLQVSLLLPLLWEWEADGALDQF